MHPSSLRSRRPDSAVARTSALRRLVVGAAVMTVAVAPALSAQAGTAAPPRRVDVQAVSLLGDSLRTLPLSAAARARYEAQLAEARRAYEHTPADLDSIIWYARRLGYVGQLRESIEIYTRGLAIHRDNPWLLRHRGHRYISVRDFDAAVRDLDLAAVLVVGKPDIVEPDGQPNPRGIPIGTLHSNIGYHLALAHYLRGDWTKAAAVARREVDIATNDDRRVSMAHWLYMSLRRSGRDAEAARLVAPMRRDMNIVENEAYHRLMLLYKGELPADSVLATGADGQMSVSDVSAAYGVANWHLANGRRAEGVRLLQRIVATGQWGAFGTIAAEADLARMKSPSKRPLTTADLYKLRSVGDPQRSPDGAWVAYTVARVDSAKDRSDSDIWMTRWDGSATVRLTFTEESESQPRWSPDGKQLAFISSRQGAKGGQVWLLNIGIGGEAEKITDLKGGVSAAAWSPDGKRLALVVNDFDPLADSAAAKPKPIVVDKYRFKQDGQGFLDTLHTHLWVFDVAARKAQQVTKGDADDSAPAWSPDGKRLAFTSAREPDAERFDNTDVYVVEAQPGAPLQRLTSFVGSDGGPLSWSADGATVAYRQGPEPKYFGYGGGFSTLSLAPAGGGAPRLLTEKLDRPFSAARWSRDGKSLVGIVADDQRQYLVRVNPSNGAVQRIASTMPVISAFSEGPDGGFAVLATNPSQPAELFALEASGLRQLTHVNDWLKDVTLSSAEPVTSRSDDGTEVHGILRRPAGASAGTRLPMLVRIHGGPAGQDAFSFDFEKEVLAAQGYAILAPNYRGSNGRGAAYTVSIAGDWCNKEVRDIRGMVDHLVKTGVADEARLGIGGWSYGGILTDCMIAADPRFKAATSGAGVSNVLGMYGHDQYIVQYELELGQPWKNIEAWLKVSKAFMNADKIKTPTLFLGGSVDWNVPILGGEQMYQALKSNRIDTGLSVNPGETHGIRRPSFQKDRLDRYLAWYKKYLGTAVVP
ncbi:MAG: prolyl oligopeptidase family serine peptidase [Gemmatimonadaceae bacterium]|nr:prolyl oligopeptidase family serine peptidase [Gemmatimonadaceae bacterium]